MHYVLTFTPSAFHEVLHDVSVKSGHHLRLQCKLSSHPTHPLTVTWTKNQHLIENYDNVTLVNDGCTLALDITPTETADTGHYKCFVTCGSRCISCSAYVAVLGKRYWSWLRPFAGGGHMTYLALKLRAATHRQKLKEPEEIGYVYRSRGLHLQRDSTCCWFCSSCLASIFTGSCYLRWKIEGIRCFLD